MRGIRERTALTAALAILDSRLSPLPGEDVSIHDAANRVLACDVASTMAVPQFDRAAMDGYAVRSAETVAASEAHPVEFVVVGSSFPGRPFPGLVNAGQAVRIMTGAPSPTGADAVVPVEIAEEVASSGAAATRMRVRARIVPGRHVGRRGEDIEQGSTILGAGRVLRPQDVGVLASTGTGRVRVVRQPRVAIVATGDELLPAGSKPEGFQIVDSNSPMQAALVKRDGGLPAPCVMVSDRRADIRKALLEAESEVVVVSGGTSVGLEDHAAGVLAEVGELLVQGVALRPASPVGFGVIGGTGPKVVFLIPGNPVSCLVAYELFAGRAIRRLGGRSTELPHRRVVLPLARELVSAAGRVDYVRVKVRDGQAEALTGGGASALSSVVRADGFVLVPHDLKGYSAGERVEVYLYD